MYHIFERLNTGGTPLKPQEIRNCVFHGGLVDVLHDINENPVWRKVIAQEKLNKYQRDVEMVLRIFAMSENGDDYEKPMKEFLNLQMGRHKSGKTKAVTKFRDGFSNAINLVATKLPEKPFHVRGPINLAAMDSILSVMISSPSKIRDDLATGYAQLVADYEYKEAIFFNTSDNVTVEKRIRKAKEYLLTK